MGGDEAVSLLKGGGALALLGVFFKALAAQEWTIGSKFKFPERNCCVCGKGQGARLCHALHLVP